jgi:hypothetical protein
MAITFEQWTQSIAQRIQDHSKVNEILLNKTANRIVQDLNRIAQARILEQTLNENLTFRAQIDSGQKVMTFIPSDPVLFKKLEFGEFNEDGTLKTPPHSVLDEWKVIIQV